MHLKTLILMLSAGLSFAMTPLNEIKSSKRFPYSAIGRFEVGCTGALIGPRHVLTAGHCVYNLDSRGWSEDLSFSPGQNRDSKPYGTIRAEKTILPKPWEKENTEHFDIALVILESKIGDQTGWFGYGVEPSLKDKEVSVVGYPGSKRLGSLWSSRCTPFELLSQWINYDCETQSGMSGGPVIYFQEEKKNNLIVGVHVLGGHEFNSAIRINSRIYKLIEKWKSENP